MRFLALAFALALAAAPSFADDFDKSILDAHNRARAALGVPPLAWNADLARGAAEWAKHLAQLGRLEHSKPALRGRSGENLWMGTAGLYGPDEMVGGWIGEKKYFVYGVFPAVTLTNDWRAIGHYTQVVWRDTKELGCARASSSAWDILVCRYSPAGNTVGERPY